MFTNLLPPQNRATRRRASFMPQVEALESRWQPAVSAFDPIASPDADFVPGQFADDPEQPQTGDRTREFLLPAMAAAALAVPINPPLPVGPPQLPGNFLTANFDRPIFATGLPQPTAPAAEGARLASAFGVMISLDEPSDRRKPASDASLRYATSDEVEYEGEDEDPRLQRSLALDEPAPMNDEPSPRANDAPRE